MSIGKPRAFQGIIAISIFAMCPLFAQFAPNRYALFLTDPPVTARFNSRESSRSVAATNYRQQLEARQQSLRAILASRDVQVVGSASTLLNAVFVTAPPSRVDELRSLPGVAGVVRMRQGKTHLNRATQLMQAPAAWTALGGPQNAGAGIKVAILDTGIDQTHPAFQDNSLSMPPGYPLCSGSPDACSYTNNKVIVARSYVQQIAAGSDPKNPAADSRPDDYSPRDRMGHGTAVASCVAGNTNSGAVTFMGMAPKAYLGNYKIYGSDGVNDRPPEDVWIQAIEDVVNDHMDVANFSSGFAAVSGPLDTGSMCGLRSGVPCDPLATAFENATKAGLVIVASAGNEGQSGYANYPAYNVIASPASAPSVITVGATLNSHVMTPTVTVEGANAPANLKNIPAQVSDSFFYPSIYGANQAPLMDVTQISDDGYACSALPPGSLTGVFALIKQGPASHACSFATKATDALRAGAAGIVFYMGDSTPAVSPTGLNTFLGPMVMVSNSDGAALKDYIDAHPGAPVMIDAAGLEQDLESYNKLIGFTPPVSANQLASYSSVGPNTGDFAIKPELVATGGFDPYLVPDFTHPYLPPGSGMYTATQSYDPQGELYSVNGYTAGEGTSFSSPLAAGAAAMVKQSHPKFTVAQIKSVLVNSAAQDTTSEDYFGDSVDVRGVGAGRLDAGAAVKAIVTAEPATISFGALTSDSLPLTRQVQFTNTANHAVTLTLAVSPVVSQFGTGVGVDHSSLTLDAFASGMVNVTLSGNIPKPGVYSGAITVQGSTVPLRIPYLFMVGDGLPANAVPIFGNGFEGRAGDDAGAFALKVVDQFGVPVANSPVTFAISPKGSLTLQSVLGEPACSPASSMLTASCTTDRYGIAYAEVILGPKPAYPTIDVEASGISVPVYGLIRQAPSISGNGIVDAAAGQAPVAPGSYISIYGSKLSDPGYIDTSSFLPLPMTLDGVTVSFDTPSAHISVPGHLTYVSPGQVNVQVPWELQGQTSAQVKVTIDEFSYGNVVTVPLADAAPAFFAHSGIVAARDASNRVISSNNAARRGQVIQLYANGLGPVTNQPASGSPAPGPPNLAETKATPVVMIGGQSATVQFSGLAPGFPGLYQINVVVPDGLTPGDNPITVAIGNQTSPAANLPVQ
ncbi:MAG TPA: S8 family serine peptidase [Bryobacteraceae bacterium]|nr:S8 family serine peptidase [Bryobacteraceae bacterium]